MQEQMSLADEVFRLEQRTFFLQCAVVYLMHEFNYDFDLDSEAVKEIVAKYAGVSIQVANERLMIDLIDKDVDSNQISEPEPFH